MRPTEPSSPPHNAPATTLPCPALRRRNPSATLPLHHLSPIIITTSNSGQCHSARYPAAYVCTRLIDVIATPMYTTGRRCTWKPGPAAPPLPPLNPPPAPFALAPGPPAAAAAVAAVAFVAGTMTAAMPAMVVFGENLSSAAAVLNAPSSHTCRGVGGKKCAGGVVGGWVGARGPNRSGRPAGSRGGTLVHGVGDCVEGRYVACPYI